MRNVFIAGVSSGIGNELAKIFLTNDYTVYGICRRTPEDLITQKKFHFKSIDLSDLSAINDKMHEFIIKENNITEIEYLFLHAGRLPDRLARMRDISIDEIKCVMDVNIWSYKAIIDILFKNKIKIGTVVFSNTKAAVDPRPGFNGYTISKAALTMLTKQYACEEPDVYFISLSLCTVDTPMIRKLTNAMTNFAEFPDLQKYAILALKNISDYTVSAKKRASHMYWLVTEGFKQSGIKSGEYIYNINDILPVNERKLNPKSLSKSLDL